MNETDKEFVDSYDSTDKISMTVSDMDMQRQDSKIPTARIHKRESIYDEDTLEEESLYFDDDTSTFYLDSEDGDEYDEYDESLDYDSLVNSPPNFVLILTVIASLFIILPIAGWYLYSNYQEERNKQEKLLEKEREQQMAIKREIDKKIAPFLRRANDAFENFDYKTVGIEVEKILEIDPENQDALLLKDMVATAAKKMAAPLKAKAKSIIDQFDSIDYSHGFEEKLDAFQASLSEANSNFDNGEYVKAQVAYKELTPKLVAFIQLVKHRNSTRDFLYRTVSKQEDLTGIADDVAALQVWDKADAIIKKAKKLYSEGSYQKSSNQLSLANELLDKLRNYSDGIAQVNYAKVKYERLLKVIDRIFLEKFGNPAWQNCKNDCEQAEKFVSAQKWDYAVKKYTSAREQLVKAIALAVLQSEQAKLQKKAYAKFRPVYDKAQVVLKSAKEFAKKVELDNFSEDEQKFEIKELMKRNAKEGCSDAIKLLSALDIKHLNNSDQQKVKDMKVSLQDASDSIIIGPNLPNEITTATLDMTLVKVEPGKFMMGSSDGGSDEKPIHSVTITFPYWVGIFEVTQKQYETIIHDNPSHCIGDKNPVERVSWKNAVDFCKKLTQIEKSSGTIPDGYQFRLLTEAEWEFAARGGNNSGGFEFAGSDNIDEVAWHKNNSEGKPHPVGMKQPNELGLFDMSGNVWEWCYDLYSKYPSTPVTDPIGAKKGRSHVNRGGSWHYYETKGRVSARKSNAPETYLPGSTLTDLGFRICLGKIIK